jgi:hypothetical protein
MPQRNYPDSPKEVPFCLRFAGVNSAELHLVMPLNVNRINPDQFLARLLKKDITMRTPQEPTWVLVAKADRCKQMS